MARRNYENIYPSVTTLISQIPGFELINWFKRTPYEEIIKKSNRGKTIGNQMHQAIMEFISTGTANVSTEYPDEVTNALKSFMLFKKEHPEFNLIASEQPLTSEQYKFNGTLDFIAKRNDELIIGDWKSQEIRDLDKPKMYPDYFTQVSAYVHLYNEVMKKNINKAIIVALAKDKTSYNIVEIDEERIENEFEKIFIPLLQIWNYKKELRSQED